MNTIPTYDTDTSLYNICSRDDYKYKKSLRNTMNPCYTYNSNPQRYNISHINNSNVPINELEQEIKKINKQYKMKEKISRYNSKLEGDKNILENINNMLYKQSNNNKYNSDNKYNTTIDNTIPYTIDNTILSNNRRLNNDTVIQKEPKERDNKIERIIFDNNESKYDINRLSKEELIELIGEMEEEIVCLNKDINDVKNKDEEYKDNGQISKDSISQSLKERLKSYIIRNNWYMNELKAYNNEKETLLQQLYSIISKYDSNLYKHISNNNNNNDIYHKISDILYDNDTILNVLTDIKDDNDKIDANSIDELKDKIESYKHRLSLYDEYFKRLYKYDSNIVKLSDEQYVKRGGEYSIEILLKTIEDMNNKVKDTVKINTSLTTDLLDLKNKVIELENIYKDDKDSIMKNLLDVYEISVYNTSSNIQTNNSHITYDNILRYIRDRITKMKIEYEDALSNNNILNQRNEMRDIELKDYKDRLNSAVQQTDKLLKDRSALEDRLKYIEIEKNNIRDIQYTTQEDTKKKVRQEYMKDIDMLNNEIASLRTKNIEYSNTIQSLNNKYSKTKSHDDEFEYIMKQLTDIIMNDDSSSVLDEGVKKTLIDVLGNEKGQQIINYDKYVNMFKLKCKLIEEIYRERVCIL